MMQVNSGWKVKLTAEVHACVYPVTIGHVPVHVMHFKLAGRDV